MELPLVIGEAEPSQSRDAEERCFSHRLSARPQERPEQGWEPCSQQASRNFPKPNLCGSMEESSETGKSGLRDPQGEGGREPHSPSLFGDHSPGLLFCPYPAKNPWQGQLSGSSHFQTSFQSEASTRTHPPFSSPVARYSVQRCPCASKHGSQHSFWKIHLVSQGLKYKGSFISPFPS